MNKITTYESISKSWYDVCNFFDKHDTPRKLFVYELRAYFTSINNGICDIIFL